MQTTTATANHFKTIRGFQSHLNGLSMQSLGMMLLQSATLMRTGNFKDREFGKLLRSQVLLAMSPVFDAARKAG